MVDFKIFFTQENTYILQGFLVIFLALIADLLQKKLTDWGPRDHYQMATL